MRLSIYLSVCVSVVEPPYLNLLEEVTPLAGCGAGTLPWGQRTACSNKAGGV